MISISEAEKTLVAFCLQGLEPTKMVCDTFGLDEEDLTDPSLRMLYAACCSLYGQNIDVSALSVQTFLRTEVHSSHFNGKDKNNEVERLILLAKDITLDFPFLKQLSGPFTAVQFLKQESQRRKAIQITMSLYDKLMGGAETESTISQGIDELMNFVHSIQNISSQAYRTLPQTIAEAEKDIEDEIAGKINWLSTGIDDLDKIIHGLHKGRLYIIGAEAKVGKSLLSNQIALNNVCKDVPTAIISMEMSGREITKRLAGISQKDKPTDKKVLLDLFKGKAKGKPLYFRQGGISPKTLFTALQKLVAEKKCELFILDYLQLVQIDNRIGNAVDGINLVLAQLKAFAEEKQVSIILVSAVLTKNLKGRKLKNVEPTGADIAGTGRAVYDCDCMLLMWVPKKNNRRCVEIFVEQGRNGESGRIQLFIDDKLQMVPVEPNRAPITPQSKDNNLFSQSH